MINLINFVIRLARAIVDYTTAIGYSVERTKDIFSGGVTDIWRFPRRNPTRIERWFLFELDRDYKWYGKEAF